MIDALILLGVVLTGALLAWPRLAKAPLWRATITPLASIIGSGFLVLGPILDVSYGAYAPLVMLALNVLDTRGRIRALHQIVGVADCTLEHPWLGGYLARDSEIRLRFLPEGIIQSRWVLDFLGYHSGHSSLSWNQSLSLNQSRS